MTSYQDYLNSIEWKIKRREILEDPYWGRPNQCLNCHSKDNLHVHHLNYKRVGVETEKDLCILCADCHNKVHFKNGRLSTKDVDIKVFKLIFGKKKKTKGTQVKTTKISRTGKTRKYQLKYKVSAQLAISVWVFVKRNRKANREKPNIEKYLKKRPNHMHSYIEENKPNILDMFEDMWVNVKPKKVKKPFLG